MRTQNIDVGSARNTIVRLYPKHVAMNPKQNDPHMAPIDVTAAIHDISSDVNGPVTSGVSDDDSLAIAGETHPRMVPEMKIRLNGCSPCQFTFLARKYIT